MNNQALAEIKSTLIASDNKPEGFDFVVNRLYKIVVEHHAADSIDVVQSIAKRLAVIASHGCKVPAIKMVQDLTNCSLRDAKEFIEYIEKEPT